MEFDNYIIRLLSKDDLQDYFVLIENNRKRLEDFFPGTVAATKTITETKDHLNEKIEQKDVFLFVVADISSGKLIGYLTVKNIDRNLLKAELAYFIDEKQEGKGIGTKAISFLVDFCFKELKLDKLSIRTHEENIPSRRIAEKNGFLMEGIVPEDHITTDGRLVDLMHYVLSRHGSLLEVSA